MNDVGYIEDRPESNALFPNIPSYAVITRLFRAPRAPQQSIELQKSEGDFCSPPTSRADFQANFLSPTTTQNRDHFPNR
jgi:hypothetical protein